MNSCTMSIIDRYVSGRFLRVFVATLVALVVVYFLVDVLEKLDPIMDHNIPWTSVLVFYAWIIPGAMVQFVFLPCLISCLVVLGVLQKNHEIIAMSASGFNLHRVLWPMFGVTMLICILTRCVNEWVVPRSFSQPKVADTFRQLSGSSGEKKIDFNFSYRSDDGKIYRVKMLDAEKGIMQDLLYYECRPNGTLIYRIENHYAEWSEEKKAWILYGAEEWVFDENGEPSKHVRHEELVSNIKETPQDFMSRHVLPQEMSTGQLKRHIEQLRSMHFDPLPEEINLWNKMVLPFWPIPVVIIGVPVLLTACRKGMAAGLGACVTITAVWLVVSTFVMPAMARGGMVRPWLSATLPTLLGIVAGGVAFARIQR